VIGVGVGQHDGVDLCSNVSERREVGVEPAAKAGKAGVDRGEPAPVLYQVPAYERAAEAVDAWDDVARGFDGGDPRCSLPRGETEWLHFAAPAARERN
jgi:hypothetical protein